MNQILYMYKDLYIYNICNTVVCLDYSIIMTTENIYLCNVSISRYNNHKVMYS